MILVNLFGVPSAGKSTGAAYIFSQLKARGINAELVTEFAKDKVWEGNDVVLANQLYIFGKQYHRISRCQDKVAVVVTDSPLLLSIFYNRNTLFGKEFNEMISKVFHSYNSLNYLLLRDKPYNPIGRLQTEEESNALNEPLTEFLEKFNVSYETVKGNFIEFDKIVEEIMLRLK